MIKAILFLTGCCGIVLGVVALFSPIPVGVIILGASLAAILAASPKACAVTHSLRFRYPRLNRRFLWLESVLEAHLPRFAVVFHQTRPNNPIDE